MSLRLLTDHNLEFLCLKGGCTGSSESTLVKIPHCLKSRLISIFGLAILRKIGLEKMKMKRTRIYKEKGAQSTILSSET